MHMRFSRLEETVTKFNHIIKRDILMSVINRLKIPPSIVI
jgi:hypothetical protein